MNNLEDCLLRHIFNKLEIHDIKKISSVSKNFNNLNYRHQCIPIGIYKWIYGTELIDSQRQIINKNCLAMEYCFLRYIKDIIYFLDDITIYNKTLYWKKSIFMDEEIPIGNNIKKILKHRVYRVNVRDYYGIVIKSPLLKAILY